MSNEQFSVFSVSNQLYPNQIIPTSPSINEIDGLNGIFQNLLSKPFISGQLPYLALDGSSENNLFTSNLIRNTFGKSSEFNLFVGDSLTPQTIDSLRQNIANSLQKTQPLEPAPFNNQLTATIVLAQAKIDRFFEQPDVANQLALAFGQGIDADLAKSVSQKLPNIQVVEDSALSKALGAYALTSNTIFLAQSLVERGNQQEIVAVLLEEIGHSIDGYLNTQDAAGDEGEIFAKLVNGQLDQADYLVMLAEDDHNQIIWQGQALALENSTPSNFTIRAAGKVTIQGNTDLDGQPLNLQDDSLIYAGQGFSIQGNTVLPVRRDLNGNPLLNSAGKFILVDRALAVSASYTSAAISGNFNANVNPPQIVANQQIDIPTYSSLEQQYLTSKTTNIVPITFNAGLNNVNTAMKWGQNFPVSGTNTQMKVVNVIGGSLTIPTGVSLSNCIIIVANGNINFQGNNQQLNNVTLVTQSGTVTLGNVSAQNLTVLSAGNLTTGNNASFNGNTLLTTKAGNITFAGATTNLNASQNLQVIAHGNIAYRSNQATQGQFFSTGNFAAQGNTNLFGTISSLGDINLQGNTTITSISTADITPPSITVSLINDSGTSNTDLITKDAGIKGQVTDPSGIAEFKVQLDGSATAIDLKSQLQTNGTFNLTDTQVRQLVGTLADGSHSLAFTTKDTAGNQSTFNLNFVLDSTAPTLALTPLSLISNDGKLVGQSTDANLLTLTYQWDSGTAQPIALTSGSFNQALDFTSITNGAHTLTITAVDKAGNVTITPYSVTVALDNTAPLISAQLAIDSGSSNTDGITNSAAIMGTVTDDNNVTTLQASLDGTNFVSILPQIATNDSISLTNAQLATIKGSALTDGAYNLRIKAQDQFGNSSPVYSVNFTLDTSAATPGQLILAAASDSGSSNADRLTNIKTPQITGTGEAGSIVDLLDGTQSVGQTTVGTDGTWQITTTNLTDGQYQLTAQQTDNAGNLSNTSPALAITIDSLAPSLTLGQSLDNATLGSDARLQGSIADGQAVTASYTIVGGQTRPLPINNGQFDVPFDFTGIADGSHQLTLTFTDAAGNSLNRTYAFNLSRGPLITVALLNDTGASNSDGITTDITILGQVADRNQISRLEIALDNETNYADFTFALQNNNSFQLSALQVNSLAGGQLSLGAHILKVRTVDTNGVTVGSSQLNFTFQANDTANVLLALASNNDSGPLSDGVTDAAQVSLIANTTPGSTLTLAGLNRTGVADANGQVVFDNIDLALGANNFTVIKDGQQQQFTFQRVAPQNVVLEWNAIALGVLQRDPYTPPPMFGRNLAMVQAAVYDAVNAIDQRYSVYKVDASAVAGTSEEAAAAAAAARILIKLYPNQQALINAALTKTLNTIVDGAGKTAGIELGNNVADQIFAWRSKDGARTQVPYQNSTEIGKWQPTLPNFTGALYPQWPQVKPYALDAGNQFRPNGLPSLNSAEYTAAYNEVNQLGARNSTVRTTDQTQIAQFWSDGSGTYTPVGHWNQIAHTAASIEGTNLIETARLFAQLNVALADAGIAAWDTKYAYNTWRPVTAIRDAGLDGNTDTTADPNWQPLIDTPPFPEYVSGHSTFSSAAAAVLGATFGDSFQFQSGTVTLPGISRSFTSFTGAAAEAGQSRIYGGIHFQFSNRDGLTLGKSIGDYVADRFLVDETKGAIQVKLALDTAAFGTTNRDRVTKVADLTGLVRLDQPGLRLQIAQVGGAFTDVTVNTDKTFNLSASQLAAAIGTLTDKTYQLTLQLVDANNVVVGSNNFSFTLDTTAPTVQAADLTGVSPQAHLLGSTDIGGAGRLRVDGGAWSSFNLQPDGKFDPLINVAGLTAGLHQVEVQIADAADNLAGRIVNVTVDANGGFYASPATNSGWGQTLSNGFALYEGNSLVTEKAIDVTFGGAGQQVLEFDLQTGFDGNDTRSFARDRVAFYLVDANGVALSIDGNRPGSLPVFAFGELGTDTIPGLVQFDGTHVKIDVSGVNATAGKLVVQLLNQDSDGRGNIKVTNFVDRLDVAGTPGQAVSPYVAPATPGVGVVLDGYLGTANGQLLLSDVSFDRNTGKYSADLRVKNVGSGVLAKNLAVLLSELPAGVTVENASGTHAAGSAYLNFAPVIQSGGLGAGAISGAIRVQINDPDLKAFSFKPVVLQGAAEPIPDLTALRNLTVKVGEKLDFALDPNLAFSIAATGNLPTGSITGDSHLIFKPAPTQVGTYDFTLIARNGTVETRQAITLTVVPDPITTTRVTGVIANTNQAGIAGVLVEFAGEQATTDATGKFEIIVPEGSAGDTLKIYGQRIQGGGVTYPFIAEKMSYMLGHDIYEGVNNDIERPIYLPTIDLSTGTTVNPNAQTVVTNPLLPGAQVIVEAGSLFDKNGNAFTGTLTITEVPRNLTPAALPSNLHPDLVVTIQPGDMVFNTPAKLSLPNRAGYIPGLIIDLWSINPNTGEFEIVGKMQVSSDGSVINTIEGGIRNSSWHIGAPPPPIILPHTPYQRDPDEKDQCDATGSFKSEVSRFSGTVSDDRPTITYQSQGIARGINLHYDSGRANPNEIIHVGAMGGRITPTDRFTTKVTLKVNGIDQVVSGINSNQVSGLSGGERMWLLPQNNGGAIDSALQVDLRHLTSGVYKYQTDTGFQGVRTWISAIVNNSPVFVTGIIGSTASQENQLVVINDQDSVFGAGWNISGLQKVIVNEDSSVLLIDGDGSHQIFSKPIDNIYSSPEGDFSVLRKLPTGEFTRTTKDGTLYEFNSQGLMVSVTDRQGNKTQHIYANGGKIQQIIDPVGLITNFYYTGNKVTRIVDPAGRTTTLAYNSQGDLISVTDPDGVTKDQYGYDGNHLVVSSIDKTGQEKAGTYDEFGRAKTATREDGSIVQINPIEVQGLKSKQETTNLDTLATAQVTNFNPISTYTDGNGNTTSSRLDTRGHILSSEDSVGATSVINRDGNLVRSEIDPNGKQTFYEYDNNGNVTSIIENGGFNRIESVKNYTTPGTGTINTFATGDINNDGYIDIATNAAGGKINILLGDQNGDFTTKYTIDTAPFADSNIINQIELKDVNYDGKLDLIANLPFDSGDGGGGGVSAASLLLDPVLVFLNQGNNQFSSAIVLPLAGISDGFVTGDFNGDSKLDILVRSDIFSAQFYNANPIVLYVGDGNGGFVEQNIQIPGISNTTQFAGGLQTASADFDGDGKNELIFNTYEKLLVYKYDSNGVWSEIYNEGVINDFSFVSSRTKFIVNDINGDGRLDIISTGVTNTKFFLNQADGSFQSLTLANPYGISGGIQDIKVANQNYDLGTKFVIVDFNSQIHTFGIDSNSLLTSQDRPCILSSPSFSGIYAGAYDINSNGSLDIIWSGFVDHTFAISKDFSYSRTSVDTTKHYTYDSIFNQLTSYTDELGRKTLYDLDANTGNVIKSTRVVGQLDTTSGETDDVTTSYTYTSTGQMNIMTDALGHITDYDYDASSNLVKTITAKGTLDEAIEQYEYDLAGNRTAMIDANGRRTSYIYNSMNMLLQSIDPLGGTTTYNYDRMGHQTSMTDALGRVTRMTYDSRGRLASTIDANGNTSTNAYDNNGNLLSVTDPLNRMTRYQYDARNRLIGTRDANGGSTSVKYDLNNNVNGSTDTLGRNTQRFYDSRDRLIREVDALGNETKYRYNAADELIAVIDKMGRITTYQYDELGRRVAEVDALGHISRTDYDKLGDVVAILDANGNRNEFKYDALNRRIEVKNAQGDLTKTSYDRVGNVIAVNDALNHSTSFNYDALNRQISIIDALGNSTTRIFDALGNLLGVTDAIGRTTTYSYDNLDRQVTSTNVLGQTKSIVYDAVGNMLSTTDELGQVTSFIYDNLNRRTRVTDALGHIQTSCYDTEGNIRSTIDGVGNTTSYDYDALNRQVKVTDALGGITSTNYDAVGNLLKLTDSVGNSTTYVYDAVNRVLTNTNQLGFSRHYGYDAVGNRVEMVDRNNRKTTYTYDSLNRQTSENWIDAGGVNLRAIGYTYDVVGNLLIVTDPDAKYTYGYDVLNRVISVDNTGTSGVPTVVFNYLYDIVGRLVTVSDRINNTSVGQTDYAFDQLNRAARITQSGTGVQNKQVDMTYNKVNQMTGLNRFSDLGSTNLVAETSYTFDQSQRLTQIAHTKGANNLASYDYTYDSANKLTKIVSSVDGIVDYSYDATNQLTGADHSSQVDEAYQYDANGNRTNAGYQTGTNNQLLADGTFTYEYDREGNRTKRTETATGKVTEYVWDYHNRLTGVVFKDAAGVVLKNIEYIYDVNNQRIGKKIDGVVTERYVLDRNQIALVFDGQGVQKSRYLYGTQVDQVLAEESGTQVRWFLTDHQGTVKDVVDNAGNVIDHITYDSFGRIVSQTNPIDLRFAYTGREWGEETGQYYYRARYYDPADGRFISEDPIGFKAKDGNLSRYTFNSPTNFTDPSGYLSYELELLLAGTENRPGSHQNIRFYRSSSTYTKAFGWALYWFYQITEMENREEKTALNGPIPWALLGSKLKNNPGRATLRPWGNSPASKARIEPKIQFDKDENDQWPWQAPLQVREVIFPTDEEKEDNETIGNTCPVAKPEKEPDPLVAPSPILIPASPSTTSNIDSNDGFGTLLKVLFFPFLFFVKE